MSNLSITAVQNNDHLVAQIQEFGIRQTAVGKPFWIPQASEKQAARLLIKMSKDKGSIYGRLVVAGQEYNVSLGMHYEGLQDIDDKYIGKEINVIICPQIPNPDLTNEDIKRIEAQNADTTNDVNFNTSKIKSARELVQDGKKLGEYVLLEIEEGVLPE